MAIYPMASLFPSFRLSPSRLISEKKDKRIPESLLAKLWKERAVRQTELRTEAGRRVRVVYPGRSGVTAGPDFRDALLEVEGVGLVRGDVELQGCELVAHHEQVGSLISASHWHLGLIAHRRSA